MFVVKIKSNLYIACNLGLDGYIFSDFGPEHTIFIEKSNPITYNIKSITKEENALITIDDEKGENKFNIGDGGIVTFQRIEGMTELNGKEFVVKYENYEKFRILNDTTNYHDYIRGEKSIKVIKNINKMYFDFSLRSNIISDKMHEFLVLDS